MLSTLLVACASTPTVVEKTKYVLVEPDETMLNTCDSTKPPKKDEYVNNTLIDKENILYTYSISLLKDLSNCNNKIITIKNWFNQQKEIYNKESTK